MFVPSAPTSYHNMAFIVMFGGLAWLPQSTQGAPKISKLRCTLGMNQYGNISHHNLSDEDVEAICKLFCRACSTTKKNCINVKWSEAHNGVVSPTFYEEIAPKRNDANEIIFKAMHALDVALMWTELRVAKWMPMPNIRLQPVVS
jgi:hypothetical protein